MASLHQLVSKINDRMDDHDSNAINVAVSKSVQKTGDTMSGPLRTSSAITKSSDDTFFDIYGGTTHGAGSQLTLYGKSHPTHSGKFTLSAHNGTTQVNLVGTPAGELSWNGKHIIRSINGQTCDVGGNIEIPKGIILRRW